MFFQCMKNGSLDREPFVMHRETRKTRTDDHMVQTSYQSVQTWTKRSSITVPEKAATGLQKPADCVVEQLNFLAFFLQPSCESVSFIVSRPTWKHPFPLPL